MNRKEFLKLCGLLGLTTLFEGNLSGCTLRDNDPIVVGKFTGKVVIIGAGAAGMAAAYLLVQNGVDVEILEASDIYGGRMKQTSSFVDFPIPLGAEWLHTSPSVLNNIVNNPTTIISTQTVPYHKNDDVGFFENNNLNITKIDHIGKDRKFVNATWFSFFSTYILPTISQKIRYKTPVKTINYASDRLLITDHSGNTHLADKIIFTAPLKMLQEQAISFTPRLPSRKQRAIQNADVWGGIKVFIEFSRNFYPTFLTFPDSETTQGQRVYFDASYGQNSTQNVLGLFAVGHQAKQYQRSISKNSIGDILEELDKIFDGEASQRYIKHVVQDWSNEPFIKSAYLSDVASTRTSRILSEPLGNNVYFAGEAYTKFDDWGSVHAAVRSARDAVRALLL